MSPGPHRSERVWRLRKLHQQAEAKLRDRGDRGVDLELCLNGQRLYQRRWASLALALADAAEKRAELERGGWMAHW